MLTHKYSQACLLPKEQHASLPSAVSGPNSTLLRSFHESRMGIWLGLGVHLGMHMLGIQDCIALV